MAKAYQYNSSGYYAGEVEDHGGPLPNNATRTAPPAFPWDHVWLHWNGAAWELVEDHRARRVTEGFAPELAQEPTDYWLPAPLPEGDDWRSPARAMTEIGPLPDGAVTERPAKPAPTLDETKAAKLAQINAETSAAILDGFDHEINGEILHFSYDRDDQQNFADTANLCRLQQSGPAGTPDLVNWKARRGNGEQARLALMPDAFLDLYMAGALTHKNAVLDEGGRRKLALEAANSVEAVENI